MSRLIVPHIWIPKLKILEVPVPPIAPRIEGEFELQLIDAASGKVKRHLKWHNMITNYGIECLLGVYSASLLIEHLSYIRLGIGTRLPNPTDVALENEIYYGFTTITKSTTTDEYAWVTGTLFVDTAYANGDLSEVGVSRLYNSNLFARELIRDANGNPVVITKTPNDTLNVTYTVKLMRPTPYPIVGTIGEYTYNVYFSNAQLYAMAGIGGDWLPNIATKRTYVGDSNLPSTYAQSGPLGSSKYYYGICTIQSYVTNSFCRDFITRFAANQANFATGIGEIIYWMDTVRSTSYCRVTFDPKIPKTSDYTLEIQHRLSFARAA